LVYFSHSFIFTSAELMKTAFYKVYPLPSKTAEY